MALFLLYIYINKEFYVNRNEFKEILEFLKPGYQKKSICEYSRNVFFLDDRIFTFNGRILIQKELKTGLDSVAVDFAKLFDFIAKSKAKEIELDAKEESLVIKAGKATLELFLNLQKEQFSDRLKKINMKDQMKKIVNPAEFKRGLSLCKYSVRKDIYSPVGNIFVDNNRIVSTDGKRLSVYEIENHMDQFFIPFDVIPVLEKYDFEGYLIEDDLIHFFADDFVFSFSNPGKVNYPSYQKVLEISEDRDTNITFAEDIKTNIDLTTILEQDTFVSSVKVEIEDNNCRITSSGQGGKLNIETEAKSTENLTFFINPVFFLSVLDLTNVMLLSNDVAVFVKDNFQYLFKVEIGEK